jgi:hypothetical protein
MDFVTSTPVIKGGIVLLDPDTAALRRVIHLQYNPESISRTLQPRSASDSADRAEALRLTGPPVETLKLEAELDAADQVEAQNGNVAAVEEFGIGPHLAALETTVYPTSHSLIDAATLAGSGALEILPNKGPLTLFVWSRSRVVPVRLTEFTIVEEMFGPGLQPLRAKVNLAMRVLSVSDLGAKGKGGSLYMAYHQHKESLAGLFQSELGTLGLRSVP